MEPTNRANQAEEAIFNAARLFSDATKLNAYLDLACEGNPDLRRRIERLLGAATGADDFFQRNSAGFKHLIAPLEACVSIGSSASENLGTIIGRYKLLEKIGEGGFGSVYLAEQREPVKRRVALKIIKLGMDTKQVVARFEAERQALALMDHPHIAKVFDGGATETGRTYFVMELVRGVPITQYCEEHRLSTSERLQLFLRVCEAVQHAHQKGIIHRDLKPSNILVTVDDGVPVPKVIDFGVAKATEQGLTEKTIVTQFHHFIGTPAYMSPEQAVMTSLDIDTRSDVYSLGVLLYELLTSKTPFDGQELLKSGLDEMRRTIREKEPPKPSKCLTQESSGRRTTHEIQKLVSLLRGDLDCIAMKCLEKDRNRRYETASGLASDIHHFLSNEPVLARPPSAAYRFQKLVRRHRVASLAVVLIAFALFLGVSVATWALLRERAARLREKTALAQANQHVGAAKDFVNQVFDKVAPEIIKLAGAANAQENLTQAGLNFVKRLRGIAGDDPELRVELARVLIQSAWAQNPGVANSVGDYASGLEHADEAFELFRAGSPSLTPSKRLLWLYHAREAAVRCQWALGKREEGLARLPELEDMLDQMEKEPGTAQWARERRIGLRLSTAAVLVDAGRPKEAIERYLQPFLASTLARSIGDDSPESRLLSLLAAYDNLTSAYASLEDLNAALPCANEAVRLVELVVKRFPLDARYAAGLPYSWSMQGYVWLRTGRVNEGLTLLAKARQEIDRLISTDAVNDVFRYERAIVAANQALAFAEWSQETVATDEREKRLSQAQSYLAEAEEFGRATKAKDHEPFLKAARAKVSRAREKIQADKRSQPESGRGLER